MKFLITGQLRSARGPRRIISFSLLFFFLFLCAHAFREIAVYGITPAEIATVIYGSAEAPAARGLKAALEDVHLDIFLYSLVLLFLDSLYYQVPPARRLLPNTTWLSALLFVGAKIAALYFSPAIYFWIASGVALHLFLLAMMYRIVRFLYSS